MKSEVVFALENAAWPALLVDEAGKIWRANAAASKLFGPALEQDSSLLGAIWSPENTQPAEQFLAHWQRAPKPTVPLKFQAKGWNTLGFLVCVCALSQEGQKLFLLQLLPEAAGVPESKGSPESKSVAADTGQAQKQKLECALQLARTVALDFNNALTSILGHTSLVLSQMEPNHPWRGWLLEVEKSAGKAAEIANDLGAFSRQEKEARGQSSGNLNLVLQRTVEVFQQNPPEQPVDWKLALERRLFSAKFDEAKMQQAFMKILENSLEALEGSGRITVQTRNFELAEATQDRNVTLPAGAYVCAEISDSGRGIDPDLLPRIFEPFFTTKGGRHRGLGLAWVYGIVTNHAGGVAVSSQVGVGTSVRVYLPAQKSIVKETAVKASDLSGTQTVLMVDDEDLLLTLGQTILSAYGYRVLTANSGAQALGVLSKQEKTVDLLITDLVMPGMSGRELMEQVRRVSPATRILCISGYVRPSGQDTEASYLRKPFTSQELLLKVKEMLASG